jgi:hypothetical protein
MGLAVNVGVLASLLEENDQEAAEWFREALIGVNQLLDEVGLPRHNEPEKISPHSRSALTGFPYSYLHHLRRFYARAIGDPDRSPEPTPEGQSPADDPVLQDELSMMSSHLLCHADDAGFYLPIEFDDIILDPKDLKRVPGGFLGSSFRLMAELISTAPQLGIGIENGHLADTEANRINKDIEAQSSLWIEKAVWLSLFEAARLSIEYKSAIDFS